MQFHKLPILFSGKTFLFNSIIGVLLVKDDTEECIKKKIPTQVFNQYQLVLNPFLIKSSTNKIEEFKVNLRAKLFAKLMVFTCKRSFLLARFLTKISIIKFDSTKTAIATFKKIYPSSLHQRTLCLPRTLFAIATSKTFKKNGTAFIGVFLPSKKMHAWIIEDETNPDPNDDGWICYQPLVCIYKNY